MNGDWGASSHGIDSNSLALGLLSPALSVVMG
jgi:hypothetical protein